MKNQVGKNIAKLRKERKLSQEQLAEQLHVTRQAISNWETGRSQPDLDMLEALASVFGTNILMVIYGEISSQEDAAVKTAERIRHLKMAVLYGGISAVGGMVVSRLSQYFLLLRSRTYNSFPHIVLETFIAPVIAAIIGITLMHILNLIGTIRIRESGIRRRVLVLGLLLIAIYVFFALWTYSMLPFPVYTFRWMWELHASAYPKVLFFVIGLLLYLGVEQ